MQKIGLLTCFIDNYGACLQAYALQNIISDFGVQCDIINYTEPIGYDKTEKTYRKVIKPIYYFTRRLISSEYNNYYKRKIKIKKFRDNYLKLTKTKFNTYNELKSAKLNYDGYVCGSDQIWNPTFYNGNNKAYFLGFAPEETIKVAYAPSFGINKFPLEYEEELKELVNRFDAISVREIAGKEILSNIADKQVDVVLDPTLLYSNERWSKLMARVDVSQPYIFCYMFGNNQYINDTIQYFKKLLGIEVVICPFYNIKEYDNYIKVYDAGPSEFLWLIQNAELVITDSFHATAFSINFSKTFYSLLRDANEKKDNMNSRIYSILELLNLQNRIIRSIDELPLEVDYNINYTEVNKILDEKRKKDKLFLQNALSKKR